MQTTFKTLLDKAREYASLKTDAIVDSNDLRADKEGGLIIPSDFGSVIYDPEDLALGQLAGRLGKTFWGQSNRVVPSDFYRQLHHSWPGQWASLTNELLDNAQTKFLVRNYGCNTRAILSDQYATLDNLEVLEMVNEVLGKVPNLEIVESGKYYSQNDGLLRDEMAIRVVVKNFTSPKDPDQPYGLGVVIRNGETGGAASEVRPLVMRTTCLNSLVMKRGESGEALGLKVTHRGSRQAKAVLLASAIAEALPMAEEGLEKFLETKVTEIDLNAIIAKLGQDQGWSEEMTIAVSAGSEGHQSVYGLINGLTYAAHEMEIDQTQRLVLEGQAAEYVYRPEALVSLSERLQR